MTIQLLFKRLKLLENSPKYVEWMGLYRPSIQKEIHDTKKALATLSQGKYFNSYL